MNKKHKRGAAFGACLCLTLLLIVPGAGCGTVRAPPPSEEKPPELGLPPAGEVLYVNAAYQFVIMRCAGIPRQGTEYGLYRNRQEVARVRIGGQRRSTFWAADILEGQPQPGDIMKP